MNVKANYVQYNKRPRFKFEAFLRLVLTTWIY